VGLVRENINFERGLEPKTSMSVGKSHLDREIMEETDWAIDLEKHAFIYDIVNLIKDYRGYPILILKNKQQESSWTYRAISRVGVFGDYQPTPEKALINLMKSIDNELRKEDDSHKIWKVLLRKNESVNFERGIDPKDALELGKKFSDKENDAFVIRKKLKDYLRIKTKGTLTIYNDGERFALTSYILPDIIKDPDKINDIKRWFRENTRYRVTEIKYPGPTHFFSNTTQISTNQPWEERHI
jgi:hypothetical protein